MKKLFCIFIIFAILSSYIFVNADSALYTCSPRINGYIQENILIFDFELSDSMPNEKFLIAAYRENKLENAVFYTVDKIRSLNKLNISVEKESSKYVVHIPHEITPDKVKIFALNDNIIPVCEEKAFFETAADILAINSTVVAELEKAVTLLTTNKYEFKGKAGKIVDNLINLAKDAIAKKETHILSREFALREYKTELDGVVDIYNSMTSTGTDSEQSIFKNKILGLNTGDDDTINYLIKYLGLSKYIS